MTTGVFAGLWDVLPCTNTLGYICKQLAEGAGLTTVPPTFTPDYCAKNWTPLRSSEYCIKVLSLSIMNLQSGFVTGRNM